MTLNFNTSKYSTNFAYIITTTFDNSENQAQRELMLPGNRMFLPHRGHASTSLKERWVCELLKRADIKN